MTKKQEPSELEGEIRPLLGSLRAFKADLFLLQNAIVRESDIVLLDVLADEMIATGKNLQEQVKNLQKKRKDLDGPKP